MSRVLLIHWNVAVAEADGWAGRLRAAGHEVRTCGQIDGSGAAEVRAEPPDVFVIDLTCQPSQGRNTAIWLRQHQTTRPVPIVFVGGDPEKVRRAREILPDATFTEWRRIRSAVRAAARPTGAAPVVPPTPGFYSDPPLAKKLGLRPSDVLALLGAPREFERTLGELPAAVRIKRRAGGLADMVLLFVHGQREMERRFAIAVRTVGAGGSLWMVWPKKASLLACDLTQAQVRRYGLARGLVDYKVASIDDTWTGLRFARRASSAGG